MKAMIFDSCIFIQKYPLTNVLNEQICNLYLSSAFYVFFIEWKHLTLEFFGGGRLQLKKMAYNDVILK